MKADPHCEEDFLVLVTPGDDPTSKLDTISIGLI
jgi:hypothetical protein